MRIGLLRHFKVNHQSPKYCNSEEYNRACREYDQSDIIPGVPSFSGNAFTACYSSSKKRALDTARLVYDGEITVTDALVEIPLRAIFETNLRLPFRAWNVINRLGWAWNLNRAPETREQSVLRIREFLSGLPASPRENILIVSHGLFLATLQVEISRMGFKGAGFFRARHGMLYEFHNENR